MAATLTRTRCNLREFLEIIDDMERSGRYQWLEVIGGELVVNSSPRYPHMKAEMPVIALLWAAEEAGYGEVGADRVIALDYPERGMEAEDVFKPDAFFVTVDRLELLDAGKDGPNCVVGAPDLIVEVLSPTTAERDLPGGAKFKAYARAGVRYYWLLDTDARIVRQFERREGDLVQVAVLTSADALTCPLFPDVTMPVARIFR